MYGIDNRALQHCQENAQPSIFQRELGPLLFFMGSGIGFSKIMFLSVFFPAVEKLKKVPNSFMLMSGLSLVSVALADLLVLFGYPFQTADLIGAATISLVIFISVVPLAHYSGCILLQVRRKPWLISSKINFQYRHLWLINLKSTSNFIISILGDTRWFVPQIGHNSKRVDYNGRRSRSQKRALLVLWLQSNCRKSPSQGSADFNSERFLPSKKLILKIFKKWHLVQS